MYWLYTFLHSTLRYKSPLFKKCCILKKVDILGAGHIQAMILQKFSKSWFNCSVLNLKKIVQSSYVFFRNSHCLMSVNLPAEECIVCNNAILSSLSYFRRFFSRLPTVQLLCHLDEKKKIKKCPRLHFS